uniref:Putative uracil permease n=1 Tax=termite gut metagenome TaxID=433724 RepID=S0DDB5_9ZZZZ
MAFFKNDLKDPKVGTGKTVVLGLQHTFTMFGATVLVPILTGLDISVALFMAGVGTWVFHLITRGKLPIFLGSSFAFITPIVTAAAVYGSLDYALGGIVVAGLVYVLFAVLIYFVGAQRVLSFFPPVVNGCIIIVIGLKLAPTAISSASQNWGLAALALAIVVVVSVFLRGFARSLPVLIGLVASYAVAAIITLVSPLKLVDFSAITAVVQANQWFSLPSFTLAKFDPGAILLVAPVAICTMVEHIGDVIAVGAIVGKDYMKDPGLHRTILGDGIATSVSAMFGGPANTTYSENTGVLALTRAYNPVIMRIAACFAILLSVVPILKAFIETIPASIIGGISIVLFGMISAVGARTLVDNKVDFHASRNLIIAAVILVIGLGGSFASSLSVVDGSAVQTSFLYIEAWNFQIEPLALASVLGIALNKILPQPKEEVQ